MRKKEKQPQNTAKNIKSYWGGFEKEEKDPHFKKISDYLDLVSLSEERFNDYYKKIEPKVRNIKICKSKYIFFDSENSTLDPRETRRSFIVITSFTNGTFFNVTLFLKRIDAAIKGRQEFLAPLISTSAFIALLGPLMINLFIIYRIKVSF